MSRWHIFRLNEEYNLPHYRDEGLYVMIAGGHAVYVGESAQLGKRLGEHLNKTSVNPTEFPGGTYKRGFYTADTPWGTFHNLIIKWRLSIKCGESAMAERRLIRRLKPKCNKQHNPLYGHRGWWKS